MIIWYLILQLDTTTHASVTSLNSMTSLNEEAVALIFFIASLFSVATDIFLISPQIKKRLHFLQ